MSALKSWMLKLSWSWICCVLSLVFISFRADLVIDASEWIKYFLNTKNCVLCFVVTITPLHISQSCLNVAIMWPGRYSVSFACTGGFTRARNMGQMWGAPWLRHQAFHIPLTDHGCKLIQVQNNTESFLWHSYVKFPMQGSNRASSCKDCVLCCVVALHRFSLFLTNLTAQLTRVISLTQWEALFRYSVWVSGQRGKRGVTERKYEPRRQRPDLQLQTQAEGVNSYIKTSCSFARAHLFLMLMPGYKL